jgi:hypothetical protein
MTEPLTKVSSIKETGKKNSQGTRLKHEKKPRHVDDTEDDRIDISEEARERAAGRMRRNILDYLNEEPA